MLQLNLGDSNRIDEPLKVLCLGAHADDIEIGCGGTILKLLQSQPDASFCWMVFGAGEERAREAIESANLFLHGVKEKHIGVERFRDGFFPYQGSEIKELFESIKKRFNPDLIFTHYRGDLHQDHRLISDITWNTFRDHLILEYEIPKYDGDLGSPNFFVYLDESICRKKVQHILNVFQTQREKHWFTEDAFLAILRLRGLESVSCQKYAEGFYCRKVVLTITPEFQELFQRPVAEKNRH